MSYANAEVETRIGDVQNTAVHASTTVRLIRDVSALIGSPVIAINGETGRVRDFLFDDRSWQVRSVVLDAGNWLRRRDVVLPVSVLELPDWQKNVLHVNLTRAQVRNGPDLDEEKPVYRQQELAMRQYFGALASWVDAEFGLGSFPTGVKYPSPPGENPHLRSIHHLVGYRVRATDGYLGRLEGFLMEKEGWKLGYLDVSVSRALHRRLAAVPTSWVERISWAEFRIYLDHARPS